MKSLAFKPLTAITRLFILIFIPILSFPVYADINDNCSEDSILITESGWDTYKRNNKDRTGDAALSASLYEQALNLSPNCRRTLRLVTGLYSQLHKIELAEKYLTRLLNIYPNDEVGLAIKSDIFVYHADYDSAIKVQKLIIEKNGTGNGASYYSIARIYALMGNVDLSLEYLNKAIVITPGWGNMSNMQADDAFKDVVKKMKKD